MSNTKDSGVEWIGEIPEDWLMPPVYAYFSVQLGKMLSPSASNGPNQHPYLGNSNVQWGRFILDDLKTMSFSQSEKNKFKLMKGDILVCEGGEIGRSAIWNGPSDEYFYQKALHRVRVRKNREVYPNYYFYFMRAASQAGAFETDGNKSTIAHLTAEKLNKTRFTCPPLETQRQIAAFLDRKTLAIDDLIAKKQRMIELLEEKRSALINHVVTKGLNPDVKMKDSGIEWIGEIPEHWEIVRLKFLSTLITSGSRGWGQFYSDEGPVFLRIGNVKRDAISLKVDHSDIQRVKLPHTNHEGSRTRAIVGDILVTITADIGSVGVVPDGLGESYVSQHVSLVKIKNSVSNSKFIAYSLKSTWGVNHFMNAMKGGTKQGLNLTDVSDSIVPQPSFEEQIEMASFIERNTELIIVSKNTILEQIAKLQEYRQALITAAVTGKIDVTHDPTSDDPAEALGEEQMSLL